MSTPLAPPDIPAPLAPAKPKGDPERYARVKSRSSKILTFACPALIFYPPRKLDLMTATLTGLWIWSGNYWYKETYGRGMFGVLADRLDGGAERRRIEEEREKVENERRERLEERERSWRELHAKPSQTQTGWAEGVKRWWISVNDPTASSVGADGRARLTQMNGPYPKPADPMDASTSPSEREKNSPDWKAERIAHEKQALSDGKGYSGLILEQVWDVWHKKDREIKEQDGGVSEREIERRKEELEKKVERHRKELEYRVEFGKK